MNRLLIACLILLSLSSFLRAEWAVIPLTGLLKETDLVVIGTLQFVSEETREYTDYSEGTILIERVVSGGMKTVDGRSLRSGDRIRIKWQNASMIACPRVEHGDAENKKGIWLLKAENDGTVSSDYPGRFMDVGEIKNITRALKSNPITATQTRVKLLTEADLVSSGRRSDGDIIKSELLRDESKPSYYPYRAAILALFFIGLFPILYRSRLRIR